MKIGYARVSTDGQNFDLQKDALAKAECSRIYEEDKSGKSLERPELDACRKGLRPGDTFTEWRVDRRGRSLPDFIPVIGELRDADIGFESVTEKILQRRVHPVGKRAARPGPQPGHS